MSMIIKDGTGKGYAAKVNGDNHLVVAAITRTIEHYFNQTKGEAYAVPFAVNPDGADDVIFYLKNNDDNDLIIEGLSYMSSAAEEIYFKLNDAGTAVATSGATMTPVNLNTGSGKTADVTCYSNTGDGAVDITGLSGGSTFDKIWITAAADNKWYNFEQDIVLKKNGVFTIYCVGGDTNIRGTVLFHFNSLTENSSF